MLLIYLIFHLIYSLLKILISRMKSIYRNLTIGFSILHVNSKEKFYTLTSLELVLKFKKLVKKKTDKVKFHQFFVNFLFPAFQNNQ